MLGKDIIDYIKRNDMDLEYFLSHIKAGSFINYGKDIYAIDNIEESPFSLGVKGFEIHYAFRVNIGKRILKRIELSNSIGIDFDKHGIVCRSRILKEAKKEEIEESLKILDDNGYYYDIFSNKVYPKGYIESVQNKEKDCIEYLKGRGFVIYKQM